MQCVLNAAFSIPCNPHHETFHYFEHSQEYDDGATRYTAWTSWSWCHSGSVSRCLHSMAHGYLSPLCRPVCSVPGCRHLRSLESVNSIFRGSDLPHTWPSIRARIKTRQQCLKQDRPCSKIPGSAAILSHKGYETTLR